MFPIYYFCFVLLYLEIDISFSSASTSVLYFEISNLKWFLFNIVQRNKQFTYTTCKNAVYLTKYTESYPIVTSYTDGHDSILATPRDSFPFMAVTGRWKWRTEVVIGGPDRKRSSNQKWSTFDCYVVKITRLVKRHWLFQQRRWMRRPGLISSGGVWYMNAIVVKTLRG